MSIYLGNLTVEQMEDRLGIKLTDEERAELNACHEDKCANVHGNDVWHCYDMPFELVVGSKSVADKVYHILFPHSSEMKCQLRVSADYAKGG